MIVAAARDVPARAPELNRPTPDACTNVTHPNRRTAARSKPLTVNRRTTTANARLTASDLRTFLGPMAGQAHRQSRSVAKRPRQRPHTVELDSAVAVKSSLVPGAKPMIAARSPDHG